MSNISNLKERLEKFKNKISEYLRGNPDLEDAQTYIALMEKEVWNVNKDIALLNKDITSLKNEVEMLQSQLKNQKKKVEDFEILKKVSQECVSLYRKVIYSERFVNKELLEKTTAATTLLELTIQEENQKSIPKKINLYG